MPVSLLTGFLGSGKTTLLNRLLASPGMNRSLVLINEFGEVGLDHLFVESLSGDMVLMQSGCVCCTIKGELESTLRTIAARRQSGDLPPFDRVLLETTGLADPGPILQLLLNWPTVSHDFRLDAVLCTVDTLHGDQQLDERAEAVRQAAVADFLLVTKTDLAQAAGAASLRARLARLNPIAARHDVVNGEIDPALLFGATPTDRANGATLERWLGVATTSVEHHHHHDGGIQSFALAFDMPLDWDTFNRWLACVRATWGEQLLRVKGVLDVVGEDAPLVVHGVHRTFHPPTLLARWPEGKRQSRLVFITRGLTRAEVETSWREFLRAVPPSPPRPSP